jgi:general stress protein 26
MNPQVSRQMSPITSHRDGIQFAPQIIKKIMDKDASQIKNLSQQEAIDKFKEFVDHESTCLFTTKLSHIPLTTRPMAVQKVCDQGNFWFLSSSDSDKNAEILEDGRVQLFFLNTGKYEFLSVYGKASITRDRKKIDELWSDIAKAWFEQGKDDPRVTVIKVAPEDGYYWDTKHGKLVSILKIAASAVTGKTLEEGVEGTIAVK